MHIENFDKFTARPQKAADYLSTSGIIVPEIKAPYKLSDSTPEEVRKLISEGLKAETVTISGGNFTHLPESEHAQAGGLWGMYSAVKQPSLRDYRLNESGKVYLLFSDSPEVRVGLVDKDPLNPSLDEEYWNKALQSFMDNDPKLDTFREKLLELGLEPMHWRTITSKIRNSAQPPQLFHPKVQVLTYGDLVTTSLTYVSLRHKGFLEAPEKPSHTR